MLAQLSFQDLKQHLVRLLTRVTQCVCVFFSSEPPVSIIGNSGHPEKHILVAGDDLILECEVSRPNATVQWLCNGKLLSYDSRTNIDSHETTRKLVLSRLQPSDSGEYTCDAGEDKMRTLLEVQGKTF